MARRTESAADLPHWRTAEQLLGVLREPDEWFVSIRERIVLIDDQLARTVSLNLSERKPISAKPSDEFVLVLLTPRKGYLADVTLKMEPGTTGRLLDRLEQSALARMMIAFRYLSVYDIAKKKREPEFRRYASETLAKLLDMVDEPVPEASSHLASVFADGWLRDFPSKDECPEIAQDMGNLHLLCSTLANRYYKCAAVRFGANQRRIGYAYPQESEARSYGWFGLRWLRRFFRAPASAVRVHAPLARLTRDYEMHLDPIEGYYVASEAAYRSANSTPRKSREDRLPDGPRDSSPGAWWRRRRGGWTSGLVFVGDGALEPNRIYVGFDLREVPPGPTGRAWAGTALGTFVAWAVVIWSLTHSGGDTVLVPELLIAMIALVSAALDNTMPSRELFNSPLWPRFALFTQTGLSLVLAIWILARGSVSTMVPLQTLGTSAGIASWLTSIDVWIGTSIAVYLCAQFIALTILAIVGATVYDKTMTKPKLEAHG